MTTIRVSERTKNAIESFRDPDQSMGEAVEEIVEEFGLFGQRRLDDFKQRLSDEYGLDDDAIAEILAVLRIVYVKREDPTIKKGVPKEAVADYESELGILTRLELLEIENGGYHLTDSGETIASSVMDRYLTEHESELNELTHRFHSLAIAFFIEFGFSSASSDHLSTNINLLEDRDWITDAGIHDRFAEFRTDLLERGFAVRNEWREKSLNREKETPIVVLPPEFKPWLAQTSGELESALTEMEAYRVVKQYTDNSFHRVKTREQILDSLTVTDEPQLRDRVNKLHETGLTSRYSEQEDPFLVTDVSGFQDHVCSRVMEVLNE